MTLDLHLVTLAPVWAPLLAAVALILLTAATLTTRGARIAIPSLLVPSISTIGLLGAAAAVLPGVLTDDPFRGALCFGDPSEPGECLYGTGSAQSTLQLLVLLVATLIVVFSVVNTAHRRPGDAAEPAAPRSLLVLGSRSALLLFSTAGAIAAIGAADVLSLVLALNLAVIPAALILVTDRLSSVPPATLVTLAIAATVSALGAALWSAGAGSPLLDLSHVDPDAGVLLQVGTALIAVGAAVAIGAAPFHGWSLRAVPADSPSIARLVLVISALAAVGVLIALSQALAEVGTDPLLPLAVLALVSIGWAGFAALHQLDLNRLLASSAAIQAGWIILPIAAVATSSAASAVGYVTVIVTATVLVTVVVLGTIGSTGSSSLFAHRGLLQRRPLAAVLLGVGLLTLAGLPPALVGVIARVLTIEPLMGTAQWWLVIPAAGAYALTAAVYLRWLVVLFRPSGEDDGIGEGPMLPWPHRVVAIVCVIALAAGSVVPAWLW